jgi:glycosyltransferase involved in cell wall biosynthesis
MYKGRSVGIIIPAHNEGTQIEKVLDSLPDFVDHIVIINDCSTDDTSDIIKQYQQNDSRIVLLEHETNKGVGGAMATGYKYAAENNFDVAVRMDGDGQMDPADMPDLLDPVVTGQADFAKGNRLFTGEAYKKIPKVRYFGNAFLSLFTKIASGYWHVADSQSGYSAINKKALKTIDWDQMYRWYGQPNDILVRLNVHNFRVRDVPVSPVYNIGEKSGMKIGKVIFTITWLLIRLFFWRMKEKYVIRDFHPLIFFYALGAFFYLVMLVLFVRMIYVWSLTGHIPTINALALFFSFMSGSQFTLFGMWFDMESNKELK